ncbi:MAG TPA: response regulator [Candidatus Acidoferrales bacterium]|nr:response regulator [Candidatus Acidoferrales bacterium]
MNSASNPTASGPAAKAKNQSPSAPPSEPENASNVTPDKKQKHSRTQAEANAPTQNQPLPSGNTDPRPGTKPAAKPPANKGRKAGLAKPVHSAQNARRSVLYAHPELDPAATTAAVLGTLLESIEEGVAHVSPDGLILYANKRFAYLIGGEALIIEPNKTHLRDMVSTDCWVDLDKGLKLAERQRVSGSLRVEEPQQHIPVRTVRLILTPVHWKSKTTIKITATEMTEVLQKNRELREKEESLHAISARIMQLQDEERRRIARDLHDITGQELAVVIMQLMQASREIRADTDSLKTITDAAGMVRKIEEEIRTLSYVLHPPLLDELGLGPALNWYVEGFTKRSGIEVKLEVQQGLPRLQKEKELALFRVVQEALTNVMRHSGSRRALILVSFNAESVTLAVRDEGKGIGGKRFSPVIPKVHGVGIMGMRERIQHFGGTIEVQKLAKGTEVVAVIPIGHAAPIETPFTDDDILQMARALGYKENLNPTAEATDAATPPPPAAPAGASAEQVAAEQGMAAQATPQQATEQGTINPGTAKQDTAKQGKAKQGTATKLKPEQATTEQIIANQAAPSPTPPADSVSNSVRKRILIADDVTRQGIRAMLQDQPDLEICGETSNALETILKAKQLGPDLIIMDLSMPGGGGFSAANRIRQARMHARILFFTTHQSPEIERMARAAGFEGLVQKTDAARDLVRGVRAVLEGNRFYNAQVLTGQDEMPKRRATRTGAAHA